MTVLKRVDMDMQKTLLDSIGNTPLVEIRHLNPNPKVRILAKLEYVNPGGSIKDRAALSMIEEGEASGELTPEKTVIEATSGNTGIGLALVCAVKGYKLLLTMSESVSQERQMILRARGAEILLTPGHRSTDGAIEETYRLARENPDRYFMTDQFNNPANWRAHYNGTAEEILQQTGGQLDVLVATLGTTGTVMGMSRRLKEVDERIQIVGVEPYLGHKIQGLKNMKESYQPEIYEKKRCDEVVNVDDDDAFETARQLSTREGLFVGMSSGAAMYVAQQQAQRMSGGTVVVILPDGGERYLSTPLFSVKAEGGISIFNTLHRKKEIIEPMKPGKVSLYTCGPTACDFLHLTECRRYVFADLLCRYLRYRGYDVTQVMNITDLDDKTIEGSEKAGEPLDTFTERFIEACMQDLETLGIHPADRYPRASEHVDDMVKLAADMIHQGSAYEKLRSIYFDISQCSEYGALSGVDIDKIRLGTTVDLDEYEKENPRDFTLFKRSKLSELKRGIFIKTEWGNVRPSWHIQCAAVSRAHFGSCYDIHTAGRELLFPHHENKIAIGQALSGHAPAKYWAHCDCVMADGKAVTKNGLKLRQLLEDGHDGRKLRYWMLSTHYRKPVVYSKQRLAGAARSLNRIDASLLRLNQVNEKGHAYPELDQLLYDLRQGFIAAMDDDLNISAALAAVFRAIRKVNALMQDNLLDRYGAGKVMDAMRAIDGVLNVFQFPESSLDPEVMELQKQREQARAQGNWDLADQLRAELQKRGVSVQDAKVQG